jgi:hypothetical protein
MNASHTAALGRVLNFAPLAQATPVSEMMPPPGRETLVQAAKRIWPNSAHSQEEWMQSVRFLRNRPGPSIWTMDRCAPGGDLHQKRLDPRPDGRRVLRPRPRPSA